METSCGQAQETFKQVLLAFQKAGQIRQRFQNALVISQSAVLWRAVWRWIVRYHGWNDNSDMDKCAPGSLSKHPVGRWKDNCRHRDKMETGKVENLAYFTSFQCTLIEIKRNTPCGLNTPSLFRGYCKSKRVQNEAEGRRRHTGGLWWLVRQLCPLWVSLKNKRKPQNKCINCRREWKWIERWRLTRRETDCVCWLGITPAERDERPCNCHVRGYRNRNAELVDIALECICSHFHV